MASVLDDYLAQIEDTDLKAKIQAEFDKTSKTFGLVFERHQQEGIKMPGASIELGAKVIVEADDTFHTVVGLDGETATLVNRAGDERDIDVTAITVAREFGDIMYPGLKPVQEIRNGKPGDPVHTVINGENYHALEMLKYTHKGKVDLIYVDPPYNTGNKTWKYNDRYVGEKDSFRHSKWLSFMEKRLLLAKELMTPTGVIIVAIGDDEHHRLRMLMDQVFGSGNFISNVTWQGIIKNDGNFLGNGVDYMLMYSRDKAALNAMNQPWRERKQGLDEIATAGASAWLQSNGDSGVATKLLRKWWSSLPKTHPAKVGGMATTNFKHVDGETRPGHVFADGALAWPNGEGPRYDVAHPVTGLPCRVPKSGWRYTEARMQEEIRQGNILFGPDETYLPYKKRFLEDSESAAVAPTFYVARRSASSHLEGVLGAKRFPYPKDHTVLARWFGMVAGKDAVILDFFGGSGTTAEAVMRLNAEDGGTRQAILVTNNELSAADDKKLRAAGHVPSDDAYEALGVFHHVTRPRISTVVTGVREDGSKYSEGLAANVAFFDLQYLDRARVKYGHEFDSLAGVFWLRAGAQGPLIHRDSLAQGFAYDEDAAIAVLFRPGRASQLASAIAAAPSVNLTHVFIVTESDEQGNVAASYFPADLTVERIYGSYLSAFQVNKKD